MNIYRNHYINCRVSPREKEKMKILAAIENRTISEMMRELIREGMKNRGIDLVDRQAVLKSSRIVSLNE